MSDFAGRSVAVTLSPTAFEDCVSIMVVDDSAPEETEFLTVSVSLIGELNSVQLTQNTATIYIVDNDSEWLECTCTCTCTVYTCTCVTCVYCDVQDTSMLYRHGL